MQRFLSSFLCLAVGVSVLSTVAGCSSTRLTAENRAAIHTIRIVPVEGDVIVEGVMPSDYDFDRPNPWMTGPLFPIGLVVEAFNANKNAERRERLLKSIFADINVDVEKLVKEELMKGLQKAKVFPAIVTEGEADAVMTVTYHYGIHSESMMADGWRPWLVLEGVVNNAAGEAVWKQESEIEAEHELPFPDPFRERDLLESLFRRIAHREVTELAGDMITP